MCVWKTQWKQKKKKKKKWRGGESRDKAAGKLIHIMFGPQSAFFWFFYEWNPRGVVRGFRLVPSRTIQKQCFNKKHKRIQVFSAREKPSTVDSLSFARKTTFSPAKQALTRVSRLGVGNDQPATIMGMSAIGSGEMRWAVGIALSWESDPQQDRDVTAI